MALQDAKAFIEEIEGDLRLAQEVRAEIKGFEGTTAEAYVASGERRGHRFSAEELGVALKALKDDAEARELDSAELEAVAGGEVYWPKDDRCSDTFSTSPTENCWSDDRCRNVINYYRHNVSCSFTYEEGEICVVADFCQQLFESPMYYGEQ